MPKSTAMLTDIGSVITTGPATATTANAISPTGPVTDYPGVCKLVQLALQEASVMLNKVKTVTDGSDPNLTPINKLIAVINGTASPSTAVLTDCTTLVTTAPTAASVVLANAANGPIQDSVGMLYAIQNRFQEMKSQLTALYGLTDSGTDSSNRTLLNNLVLVLV